MWADNETSVDLLGFDYLLDSLELVLTNERLLPVTVGVLGDWGSGKSSVLKMVGERLAQRAEFVIVEFSPWRFEAYEDVKAALMAAILQQLDERVRAGETDAESLGRLRRLGERVRRLMAGPAAAARVLAPVVGAAAAPHAGLAPEVGASIAQGAVAGIDAVKEAGVDADEAVAEPLVFESIVEFRDEFANLVAGIEGLQAVIVLIDDLDRCLPETIVQIFEVNRLFLHVPHTAHVIAAHREIVQAAIEGRYPVTQRGDASLGRDYLEKIIQVEINVPPLAEPEAETFLNLLFAELRLNSDDFTKILGEAKRRRADNQLSVAMNYGIADGVLEFVPSELQRDFEIANRIAPTLTRGLRGNPRQLKRFLNTLLLRLETAGRRGVTLDPAVLAKLMVLEQQASDAFEQLFRWQLAQDGLPQELVLAEQATAAGKDVPEEHADARTWASAPIVRGWLRLDPPLAGIALGQYFFFSRDRLSPAAPGARLSTKLQVLLARLQASTDAQRRAAIIECLGLGAEEFSALEAALLDRAVRFPSGPAMDSALEMAAQRGEWAPLASALSHVPPNALPPALPAKLTLVAKGNKEIETLLDRWGNEGPAKLKTAVQQARKGKKS